MDTNLWVGANVFLTILFLIYWHLLFRLIDEILEKPRLNKQMHIVVSAANTAVMVFAMQTITNMIVPYIVMLVLMFTEFTIFYRDKFMSVLLCVSASIINVLAIRAAVTGAFALVTGYSIVEINSQHLLLTASSVIAFALIDLAIVGVLRFVPIDYVRIINRHKEQQWFMIAWMTVNNVYLFVDVGVFDQSTTYAGQPVNEIAFSLSILIGLYIMLFFTIKSCALLGYKEKNAELEQAVAQEQQYRESMTSESIAIYEFNLTQDCMIKGCKDYQELFPCECPSYFEMCRMAAMQIIHPDDVKRYLDYADPKAVIDLFEHGKSESFIEYRRLLPNGIYSWVRGITNLVRDVQTNDIKGLTYVKDIDKEKMIQLELEYKAARDPLTGLYNKEIVNKLVSEHLLAGHEHIGSALFMIDVDNFKTINDSLSHVYGDAVLCELADKLQKIFRSDDIVGRIGGDEYMAYLKNCTSLQKIEEKAQEICRAFHIVYDGRQGEKYIISASIGISLTPKDGSTFAELYKYADAALYQAKNKGKNKYVFYTGDVFTGYKSNRTEINGPLPKNFRQNKIEYVFKILYQSEGTETAIRAVLELVASHFAFERGYIFENSRDGKTTSNTFEWCATGVTPEIDNLQNIPIEVIATANAHFNDKGIFIVKSLDELKPIERAVLEPQGIKSMFQFGIFDKKQLLGLIGFDNCRSETLPSDMEIDEISTICNILSFFFVRQHRDQSTSNGLLLFQDVMNHLENYIYVINLQTFEVLFMNEKTRSVMQDFELGEPCYQFFRGNDCQCVDCPVRDLKDGINRRIKEIYNEKFHFWTEATATTLRWRDGSMAGLINCIDISKQKEEQLRHITQLENIAYVDELTKGLTYYKFKKDSQWILESQQNLTHFIVKLDVDNFKLVNQLYGYEKGDQVLCNVALAISKTVRDENEIFARVVNDEFVALFTLRDPSDVQKLYENFLRHFQALMGDDFPFRCNFPHGRYILRPSDIEKFDIMDILEKVNLAHKAAKKDKSLDFVVYDESMIEQAIYKKGIENKMVDALKNGEFLVYLQPKYWLQDQMIGGAEALVRWKNNNQDLFYPDAFIPAFEQNGFIIKLDFYMLDKVCAILKGWSTQGLAPVVTSVNFSRLHLSNPHFVRDLCDVVDRYGLDHAYIEIEITETVIYDNISTLEILLEELHKSGFTMSMDDFGSGYSSLGMLKNLPVDVIKMDSSFFADQKDAQRAKIVVSSVISMAANLGIHVVAEGIEEKECFDLLRDLHCEMGQGYYFAKPMPIEDFTQLLIQSAAKPRQ